MAEVPWAILQDFVIHWFDYLVSVIGDRAERAFAMVTRASGQPIDPGLLSQVQLTFPGGPASLAIDGKTPRGALNATGTRRARLWWYSPESLEPRRVDGI